MPNFCLYLFSFCNYVDIFRIPLTFTLDKKEKISTFTGKLFTLGLLSFILYSFLFSDVINKANPQILTQEINQASRPYLRFSKENLTMAFGITDESDRFYFDQSIFSFVLSKHRTIGKQIKTEEFLLKPCTADDLKKIRNNQNESSLAGVFCLPDQVVTLGGYWDEPNFEYFTVEVRLCENSSVNSICSSASQVSEFFKEKYVQSYFTINTIHIRDYKHPITQTLKISTQKLKLHLKKVMNMHLKKATIETDDGFYFESQRVVETYIQGESDLESIPTDQNSIYELAFFPSNQEVVITRDYQKIQNLLAQMGGMCNFLFFMGLLFCRIENHYRFVSFLSNEMFHFTKDEEHDQNDKRKNNEEDKQKVVDAGQTLQIHPLAFYSNLKSDCQTIRIDPKMQLVNSPKLSSIPTQSISRQSSISSNDLVTRLDLTVNRDKLQKDENSHDLPKLAKEMKETDLEVTQLFKKSSQKDIVLGLERSMSTQLNLNKEAIIPTKLNMDPKKSEEETCHSLPNSTSEKIEVMKTRSSFSDPHSPCLKEGEKIYDELSRRILEGRQFDLGFFKYLKLLLKGKRFLNSQEKIYLATESKVSEEINITKIMKKLHEIEQLKRVLLNEDQLYFFNLISKPRLSLETEKHRLSVASSESFDETLFKENFQTLTERATEGQVEKRMLRILLEDYCYK